MAYQTIMPSVTASGMLNGLPTNIDPSKMTITGFSLEDGTGAAIYLSLTPSKTMWDDYSASGQLIYELVITNDEILPYTAPISVEIGNFDTAVVSYVQNSVTTTNISISLSEPTIGENSITFTFEGQIDASSAVSVTFALEKPAE